MKILEQYRGVVVLAAFGCYFLAFLLIVLLPAMVTNAQDPVVTDVNGNPVKVPPYTAQEAAGRKVYIEQVCWHCHSQYVRPVMDEEWRYGPVSQPGESAWDTPHLFGTRRIGPDLAREGWLRTDDWHLAHLYDPRSTVPLSVMPSFLWLFRDPPDGAEVRKIIRDLDSDGDGVVSQKNDDMAYWPPEAAGWLKSSRLDNSGVEAPAYKQKEDGSDIRPGTGDDQRSLYQREHDRWTAVLGGDGLLSDHDARPVPTQEALDVVAYLQQLGTRIGPWRQPIDSGTPVRMDRVPMFGVTAKWKNSKGEAQETVLEDGEMPLRSREARRYGLAWEKATPEERAVAEDAKAEYEAVRKAWFERNPRWKMRLERGAELYKMHCATCHGDEGRGNGAAAQHLLIRPRDFTLAQYRYRSTQAGNMPLDGDLYRSIHRGLWGTAMPSWRGLSEDHLWLLVDYVKSLTEKIAGEAKPFDQVDLALQIPPVPKIADDAEAARRIERGRAVYFAMQCFNCHGSEGRGDGPGWNTTTRDDGAIFRPRDLKRRDARDIPALRLRGGASPYDLYRTIFTGLTGTQMKSSFQDFDLAWKAAKAVDDLVARNAPEAEVKAARELARRKLQAPTGLDLPGVVKETDEKGLPVEYLERVEPGDDWNLVLFVMKLLEIPVPIAK